MTLNSAVLVAIVAFHSNERKMAALTHFSSALSITLQHKKAPETGIGLYLAYFIFWFICIVVFSCSQERHAHGKYEKCIQILVRIPVGKEPLGKPRRRSVDDIRMDVMETEWESVD